MNVSIGCLVSPVTSIFAFLPASFEACTGFSLPASAKFGSSFSSLVGRKKAWLISNWTFTFPTLTRSGPGRDHVKLSVHFNRWPKKKKEEKKTRNGAREIEREKDRIWQFERSALLRFGYTAAMRLAVINFWTFAVSSPSLPTREWGLVSGGVCMCVRTHVRRREWFLSDLQAPQCHPQITAVERVWLTESGLNWPQGTGRDLHWLLSLLLPLLFSLARTERAARRKNPSLHNLMDHLLSFSLLFSLFPL